MRAAGRTAIRPRGSPTTHRLVVRALGDRIGQWALFNEPKTFTGVGYWNGRHAPGRQDWPAFLRATHTVNLGQGMAFRALKAINPKLQLGSAFDVAPMFPATSAYEDIAAAERWHRFQNLWFVIPALRGHYPEGVLPAETQAAALGWREGDDRLVRAPLDFMGLNYYSPWIVKHSDRRGQRAGPEHQWPVGDGAGPHGQDRHWLGHLSARLP